VELETAGALCEQQSEYIPTPEQRRRREAGRALLMERGHVNVDPLNPFQVGNVTIRFGAGFWVPEETGPAYSVIVGTPRPEAQVGQPTLVALAGEFTIMLATQSMAESVLGSTYRRLDELMTLRSGWDSYRARSISSTAVGAAKSLLSALGGSVYPRLGEKIQPYAVVPLPTGGVQLEWRGGRGSLEVEVKPEGSLCYLLEVRQENVAPQDEDGEATSEQVPGLLERIS